MTEYSAGNTMKKFICLMILSLALFACSDNGGGNSLSGLEKTVTKQALEDPETSISTFMEKIETASVEEQGVYMYGMAVAREKMGDKSEAINDYLSAEALGNESAKEALQRLGSEHYAPQP